MKLMKRSLSLMLAAALLFSAVPVGLLADLDIRLPDFSRLFSHTSHASNVIFSGSYDNIRWTLNDECTVNISGTGEIKGYMWSYFTEDIKRAVIEDGITSIGNSAFSGCKNLTSVTIPNSVTRIGDYAFSNCKSLTSVTIPGSVTRIGDYAFNYCPGLTSVTIPGSVTGIGDCAFNNCWGLTSVTISGSVTSLGNDPFRGCSKITNLTIGKIIETKTLSTLSITTKNLQAVTILDGVTDIAASAFSGCDGLTSLTVASNNTAYHSAGNCIIETETKTLIAGCGTSVIPSDGSVTSIGKYAFYECTGLTGMTIPDSVTSIGDSAFSGCANLASVTIPNSVTSIGVSAFYHTAWYNSQPDGLVYAGKVAYAYKGTMPANTSVKLQDGTTEISGSAFSGCTNLARVTIPNSVTCIGNSAFDGCTGLTNVTIPNSVTSIGNSVFRGCTGLTNVTIQNNVTSIGDSAFDGCTGLTNVTIPNNVTSIGNSAFRGCTGLTSVTIPNSVMSIGDLAFSGCTNLRSVTIPDSVKSIGDSAFNDTAWYNAKPDGVVYVGKVAYRYKGKMPANAVIKIKPDTKVIAERALSGCTNLRIMTLPDSVTSIGDSAFGGCSALSHVYYAGDKNAWANIALGSGNTPLTSANIHYSNNRTEPIVTYFDNDSYTLASAALPVAAAVAPATPKQYKLTFIAKSGSVSPSSKSIDAIFQCWEGQNGASYLPGEMLNAGDDDLYLFARWTDPQAGELPVAIREGYTLDGWYTSESGGTKVQSNTVITCNMTLYAHWTANTYTVHYYGNGATSGSMNDQKFVYDVPQKLYGCGFENHINVTYNYNDGKTKNKVDRIPYAFSGWISPDLRNRTFSAGESVSNLTAVNGGTVTLYACWGGDLAELPYASRKGYVFEGWYSSVAGGWKVGNGGDNFTPWNDITYYAHWTVCTHQWDSGRTYPAPTCTKTGVKNYTCTVCKETKTETIAKLGHAYGAWTKLNDIQHQRVCSRCKETENANHSWNISSTIEPTVKADGVRTYICNVCNGTKIENLYAVSYDANGGTGAPTAQTKTEGKDLTLNGAKPAKSYKLTYNANGGTVSPDSCSRSATFLNWNTKQDGTGTSYAAGATYKTDASATLYAQWKNPTAGDLATPVRDEYIFDGWYTAKEGGTEITKESTVSESQTVYAHWIDNRQQTFVLSYDANGGTGAPEPQTMGRNIWDIIFVDYKKPTKTTTVIFDPNDGSAERATLDVTSDFRGWNTEPDGSGILYNPGDAYIKKKDIVLYAQWRDFSDFDFYYFPIPERDGYEFDGWYTAKEGGEPVSIHTPIPVDNTLYAHWTKLPTFTVSYDSNGGMGAPSKQTKTEGKALTLSTAKPTKSYKLTYNANGGSVTPASKTVNAAFKGWNTAADGSGTSYAPGGAYKTDANATLYAQWTNPTAGDLPTPTRSGYTFAGWYTAASGGTKITKNSVITKSQTLYAHWTENPKKTYTVFYNANGGTGAPANQTKTQGTALTLSSTKPTKSYKLTYNANGGSVSSASKSVSATFKNWNTKQDGSGTSYTAGATYKTDADVTLYARWANPTAGDLPTPTRKGYLFEGWFTAAQGGTQVSKGLSITKDTTIYAHWTAIQERTTEPTTQRPTEPTTQKPAEPTTQKPTEKPPYLYMGDVDHSDDVTAADARLALRQAVGLEQFTDDQKLLADMDMDQSVSAADARLILRTAVGLESLWRVGEEKPKQIFAVVYNANGGKGAPGGQTKTEGKALTLSAAKPTKAYTLTYNANGGSVTPASKTVNAAFKSWNTASDGKGTSYAPGGTYKTDADATLYARWTNPAAGDLPTPTRSGYTFAGWYTAKDGGTKVTKASIVGKSLTLYAHWNKKNSGSDADSKKLKEGLTPICFYGEKLITKMLWIAGGQAFFYEQAYSTDERKLMTVDLATGEVSFIAYADAVLGEDLWGQSETDVPKTRSVSEEKLVFFGSVSGYNKGLCQYDIKTKKVTPITVPGLAEDHPTPFQPTADEVALLNHVWLNGSRLWYYTGSKGYIDLNAGKAVELVALSDAVRLVPDVCNSDVIYFFEQESPYYYDFVSKLYRYTVSTGEVAPVADFQKAYGDADAIGQIVVIDGLIYNFPRSSTDDYMVKVFKEGKEIGTIPYATSSPAVVAVNGRRVYFRPKPPHYYTMFALENGEIAETYDCPRHPFWFENEKIADNKVWYNSRIELTVTDGSGRKVYGKNEYVVTLKDGQTEVQYVPVSGTLIGEDANYIYLYGQWPLAGTSAAPDRNAAYNGFWRIGKDAVLSWNGGKHTVSDLYGSWLW